MDWGPTYNNWVEKRVKKLVELLGESWFNGKHVLDTGCGHGNNGKALQLLGAQVTFTDARQAYVDELVKDGMDAFVMDNDKEWTVSGPFDLIIHWGLLYHLDNWKQDLRCAVERSPLICLESTIAVSPDPTYEEKPLEPRSGGNDHAFNGVGSIMTAEHLENYVTELGCSFIRYDLPELDSVPHCYSWADVGNTGYVYGHRRFWIIRK